MDLFLEKILTTDKVICDNIDKKEALGIELLSQNIIAQLRNFVEAIARFLCRQEKEIADNQKGTQTAISYIKSKEKYLFLVRFHKCLQVSVSHSTVEPDVAIRLMHRYWDYLYDCKTFLKKEYDIDVLRNLDNFPIEQDETLKEYYEKISIQINKRSIVQITESPTNRYYVHKKKVFRVNGEKYYEITLSEADNKASKFDNIIAFTKLNIPTFYAIHPRLIDSKIHILNREMPIQIIVGFKVSVRPCEFDNFFKIINHATKVSTNDKEYKVLMNYLTKTGLSLTELIDLDEDDFVKVKSEVCKELKSTHIFDGLTLCRRYYDKPGYNVLVYLLHKLRNVVIKDQYYYETNEKLSNLRLKYKCIGFDTMPFAFELSNHFTNLGELFSCINPAGREHELLGRLIKNNTEIRAKLYTPESELDRFRNIDSLIAKYNSLLYYKHREEGSLMHENGFVYINGYEKNTIQIIQQIRSLTSSGLGGYVESFEQWIQETGYKIDSEEKDKALRKLFASSKVALIYGSAGTGKSTMVKHISNFFSNRKKIYLTNTHSAKENLKRYVNMTENNTFSTIKYYISNGGGECDVLFIDECSTVSNVDMVNILQKTQFKLLVLVGDIYQIESIRFGNWFAIARSYIPQNAICELTYVHRSTDDVLKALWESVRKLDGRMADLLDSNHYSVKMDESIFSKVDDDEIVLCLNYDGLYGINNINKFLQNDNKSKFVKLGMDIYKVNDRIIFKENERFGDLLYNNLKGKIIDIEDNGISVKFYIEVEKAFNDLDVEDANFKLEPSRTKGKSVVSFDVKKFANRDDDDKDSLSIVPFQIAYAISIHKAQGLEYDSVKIVITDEFEELISHNVFYTAITRAKNNLKIYWTEKAQRYILEEMRQMYNKQDASIIAKKYKLKTYS